MNLLISSNDYQNLIESIKNQVQTTQVRVATTINKELILLYYAIGTHILAAQQLHGWGSKVIQQLSQDLKMSFPEMKGFSPRNLLYMRKFAEEHTDSTIVQRAVAQLPWGHIVSLLDMVPEEKARLFYIEQTIANGWSRNALINWIKTGLHLRQGKAITNFSNTLPQTQTNLASETFKDPYIFDFLSLSQDAKERDVEMALIKHMEKFLLKLGAGFAFVGRQKRLEIAGQDFFLDLLFYHTKLRCYVVVELKDGEFKPEYAGKMNFYLSAVDDLLRHPDDQPSIGLILCKTKNSILAEYTLRDINKPVGLAEYNLETMLPGELKTTLPSIEEIEAELTKELISADDS